MKKKKDSFNCLDKNDDVFVCGGKYHMLLEIQKTDGLVGQNGKAAPFQSYIGGKNDELEQMSAILDTKYWTWRIPKSSPLFQPLPQSHGLITFVNETKLIYGYGNMNVNFHKYKTRHMHIRRDKLLHYI